MDEIKLIQKFFMEIPEDIYKLGMKKISVSVSGVRNSKSYAIFPKAKILPELLIKRNRVKFMDEFYQNIKSKVFEYSDSEEFKKIVDKKEYNKINKNNFCFVYFHCINHNVENNNEIINYILKFDYLNKDDDSNKRDNILLEIIELNKEIKCLNEDNEILRKKVKKIEETSQVRKEKIQKLEMETQIKTEKIQKLEQEIKIFKELLKSCDREKLQMEDLNEEKIHNNILDEEDKKIKIAIIGKIKKTIKDEKYDIHDFSILNLDEFFECDHNEFTLILVDKSPFQVSQLRKLRKIQDIKFFSNEDEILKFLKNNGGY
jgi:hypothetical protein